MSSIISKVFISHIFFSIILLQVHSAELRVYEDGYCMTYGHCGTDESSQKPIPCYYNGPSQPLTDSRGLKILEELCPWMLAEEGQTTYTCCDPDGLNTLLTNVQPAQQTLDRCPSCYRNFLNLLCSTTCSPNQSVFMNVTQTEPYTPSWDLQEESVEKFQGNETVLSVDVWLEGDFAHGMYNACKDVNFPSTNTKVMALYCGQYGADHCSAQRWLDFIGSKDNGQTPFAFNYMLRNNSIPEPEIFTPLNITIHPCNEGFGNNTEPCSCQDCPKACPPIIPPPPTPPPCKIAGIDCFTFAVSWCYLAFVLVFTLVLVMRCVFCASKASGTMYSEKGFDVGCREAFGEKIGRLLRVTFQKLGYFVAENPFPVIFACVVIVLGLSCGILMLSVTTDPVELWSPPQSEARLQKNYFDEHFGPFYRTEQLIIQAPHTPSSIYETYPYYTEVPFGPVLNKEILHMVLDLQDEIADLKAYYVEEDTGENKTIGLEDICFAPLAPQNKNCTIVSVLNYFQNSHEMLDKNATDGFFTTADYHDHILSCTASPTALADTTDLHTPCMGTFGGPVYPWTALAGYDGDNYNNATILVITFPVNNYKTGDPRVKHALAWEKVYLNFMKNYSNENLTIAYQAERSVEDEIGAESDADIVTIAVSYLVMFGYVSIALGQFRRIERLLIDSKILLGLSGVVIVFCSVASAVGALAYFHVPATLIVIEVVPFLVLAVGVDNIFILVQTYQRSYNPNENVQHQVARVLGEVGPSMLLTSTSESVAFYLGALSDMPAVKAFSLYAATAVLVNFLLQITCFVALLSLDSVRQKKNYLEIVCCFQDKTAGDPPAGPGLLQQFVEKIYSPCLLTVPIRWCVMVFFSFIFFASLSFLPKLSIGLDQTLSMPERSYMLDYFNMELNYLKVGPPVYFVVKDGFDYESKENQNMICGTTGCNSDSLTSQIYFASHQAGYQHVAHPASSWIDDYFDWSKSGDIHKACCRVYNGTDIFCPSSVSNDTCVACRGVTSSRPTGEDFSKYLPFFLEDFPCINCSKGGKAAYSDAVNFTDSTKTKVGATYFMTYHTINRNSSDYITAIERARNISANITTMLKESANITDENFEVFPYSVFYVFYEQYLTMYRNAIINLSICTGAIFLITFLLLGCDLVSALICTGTIIIITVDLMGVMYLWGIELNAVSVVNLVMSVGISVEFCSHITRAFAMSVKPTRVERAHYALAHIGSSVLSGITLTKALGIIILFFSRSQLFKVYYFRMYLSIVILGGSHGLIFLPVLLSFIGPSLNKARLARENNLPSTQSSENSPLLSDSSIQADGYNSIHA